jgi:(+)-neomenthol dehydrogenase
MLPLLQAADSPIIVNVASQGGKLHIFKNEQRRTQFSDPNLRIEDLEQLCREFVSDVQAGVHMERGWPNTCYGVSKAAVNSMTRIFARDYPAITVNSCCPG